jgi:hypothetical protein
MTDSRRPLHVGTFIGLSTGAYALSLALVTALQAQADANVLADRGPTAVAIGGLSAQHDALETDTRRALVVYDESARAYTRLDGALATVESQLAGLAEVVGKVEGAARALPDHVALPRIGKITPRIAAPKVHATTAASGG